MEIVEDLAVERWGTPPDHLFLAEGEVHVWRAKLKSSQAEIDEMLPVLSRTERREAKRHDEPAYFAASRHLVRTLLSRYLDRDPAKLRLRCGQDGRLSLVEKGAPHFDLTRKGPRALFAISATQRLAVDLEVIPDDFDVSALVRKMPPREARLVEFFSETNRANAVVGYESERQAMRKLAAQLGGADSAPSARYRVERLKVGGARVAALAAEGPDWSASFWQYLRPGEIADAGDDE